MTKPITSVAALMLYERGAAGADRPDLAVHPGVRRRPGLPRRVGARPGHRARDRADPGLAPAHPHRRADLRLPPQHPVDEMYRAKGYEFGAPRGHGPRRGLRRLGRAAAAVPAGHRVELRRLHRRAGPGRRGRLRPAAGRVPRRARARPAGHDRHRVLGRAADDLDRLATLYLPNPRGGLVPQRGDGRRDHPPADASCPAAAGWCPPPADYHRFTQMLARGGELDGVRLLVARAPWPT